MLYILHAPWLHLCSGIRPFLSAKNANTKIIQNNHISNLWPKTIVNIRELGPSKTPFGYLRALNGVDRSFDINQSC